MFWPMVFWHHDQVDHLWVRDGSSSADLLGQFMSLITPLSECKAFMYKCLQDLKIADNYH